MDNNQNANKNPSSAGGVNSSSSSAEGKKLLKKAKLCLPKGKLNELADIYKGIVADEAKVQETKDCIKKMKNPIISQALSIIGILGLDRLYIGDKRTGLTKLCTLGGVLVFWVYDIFNIIKRTRHINYLALRKAMGAEIEEFDLDKLNK